MAVNWLIFFKGNFSLEVLEMYRGNLQTCLYLVPLRFTVDICWAKKTWMHGRLKLHINFAMQFLVLMFCFECKLANKITFYTKDVIILSIGGTQDTDAWPPLTSKYLLYLILCLLLNIKALIYKNSALFAD